MHLAALYKGNQCSLQAKFEVTCVCFPSPWAFINLDNTVLSEWVTALSPSFPPTHLTPPPSRYSSNSPTNTRNLAGSTFCVQVFSHLFLGEGRVGGGGSSPLTPKPQKGVQRAPSLSKGDIYRKQMILCTPVSSPLPPHEPWGRKRVPGRQPAGGEGMIECSVRWGRPEEGIIHLTWFDFIWLIWFDENRYQGCCMYFF